MNLSHHNKYISKFRRQFYETFKREPTVCVRAPGRVNLIGEHIDYNGGIVLPIAIEKEIHLFAALREDNLFRLQSLQMKKNYEGTLSPKALTEPFWINYVFGVVNEFVKEDYEICGFDALYDGDIPIASGLSSSAAIEVATAYFLHNLLHTSHSKLEIALLCQRAENDFVGIKCGLMDQAISMCGIKGNTLKLDCSIPSYELIPIDFSDDTRFLIAHSGVFRGLSSSAYNERRNQCEETLKIICNKTGYLYKNLCEVPLSVLNDIKGNLHEVLLHRAHHVISEQERVVQAIDSLKNGDKEQFGKLLIESHKSLVEDYEVSCPELDDLTNWLRSQTGIYGSRLTGAGFGGCTISLVEKNCADKILGKLNSEYYSKRGVEPLAFFSEAEQGASII